MAAKERRERKMGIRRTGIAAARSLRSLRSFAANSTRSLRSFAAKSATTLRAMKTIFELCDIVRETAYAIHHFHAHGHLEKVYENALAHRLRKAGWDVKQQHPITVRDEDGTVIGEFFADLLVDDRLVIELKAAKSIADEHIAQLLGYLKSSGTEHGLLINFGSFRFEIRKFVKSQNPPKRRGVIPSVFAFLALLCGH